MPASQHCEEMHRLDLKKFPVTTCLSVDLIDLSFLLCSSGMYMYSYMHYDAIHITAKTLRLMDLFRSM